MTDTITTNELRAQQAATMPERELQENVRQLCKSLNALYYHTHRSDRSPAGFPDCVIVTRPTLSGKIGRAIFAELKSEKGRHSPEQHEWIAELYYAGQEVYTWRPSDWLDGTIERILTGETT